jgi:hypothetical protein
MLIPWTSGRLAALAVASALAACGDSGPGGGPPACDYNVKQVGCVDLINAHGGFVEISGITVPPTNTLSDGGVVAPGHAAMMVTNTSVGATNTFTARVSGADAGSATCTVTSTSWADVNPSVVLQPANFGLTCGIW